MTHGLQLGHMLHLQALKCMCDCKTCIKASQGMPSPVQGHADQWADQYAADNAEGDWADQFANQFADGTDPNQWMEEFAQDMDARTAAAEAGTLFFTQDVHMTHLSDTKQSALCTCSTLEYTRKDVKHVSLTNRPNGCSHYWFSCLVLLQYCTTMLQLMLDTAAQTGTAHSCSHCLWYAYALLSH